MSFKGVYPPRSRRTNMHTISEKALNKANNRLSELERAMQGLAAVFLMSSDEICLKGEEFCGLGHLMQIFARETRRVELLLLGQGEEE